MNMTQRFAFSAFAALALISTAAAVASARSDGDRYLPLPKSTPTGRLVAAPVSDTSMGLMEPSTTAGQRVQELIERARVNKKN